MIVFSFNEWDNRGPERLIDLHKVNCHVLSLSIVLSWLKCNIRGMKCCILSTMISRISPKIKTLVEFQSCWSRGFTGQAVIHSCLCLSLSLFFFFSVSIVATGLHYSLLKSVWAGDLDVELRASYPCDSAALVYGEPFLSVFMLNWLFCQYLWCQLILWRSQNMTQSPIIAVR